MACADPERGSNSGFFLFLFFCLFFFLMKGERIGIALKEGHHLSLSETPFKQRFTDGPMIAQQ